MTYYSFEFLKKRPEDFGEYIRTKTHDIGFPARTKVTATIPFSNTTYDFSNLYGTQSYGERKVQYVINVFEPNHWNAESMHHIKSKLVNWLESGIGQQELYDDKVPGWHFLGEPQDALSLDDKYQSGELTVSFVCYPFMIRNKLQGDDIWDTFEFEVDVSQITTFDVVDSMTVILVNDGITTAYPKVTSDSEFTITVGANVYTVESGDTTGVQLPVGANYVAIAGKGHISFEWHKEVI